MFNERIYINDKYIENNVIHNNNTFLNKKRLNDKNNEKDQVIDSKKLINDDLDNPNEDLAEDKIINNEQKNKNIIGNNNLLNIKINKLNNDKQIIHKNIKLQTVIDLDENGKSNAGKNNDNTLFDKKIHDKIIRLSFFDSYEKYGNKGNAIHHDIKQIFLNHPVFFSDYPGVNINNYMKNKKAKQRMDDLYNCYKTTIKKVLLSNGIKWSSTKHFKKG